MPTADHAKGMQKAKRLFLAFLLILFKAKHSLADYLHLTRPTVPSICVQLVKYLSGKVWCIDHSYLVFPDNCFLFVSGLHIYWFNTQTLVIQNLTVVICAKCGSELSWRNKQARWPHMMLKNVCIRLHKCCLHIWLKYVPKAQIQPHTIIRDAGFKSVYW